MSSRAEHRELMKQLGSGPRPPIQSWFCADTGGSFAIISDHSGVSHSYFVGPSAGQAYVVERMIVYIEDGSALAAANYGAISGGLANGIDIQYTQNGTRRSLCGDKTIQTNANWSRQCFDLALIDFGAGVNSLSARYTFSKHGQPIYLDGDNGDQIEIIANDDFTGLTDHTFLLQGYQVK